MAALGPDHAQQLRDRRRSAPAHRQQAALVDDLLGLWPVIGFACAGAVALFLVGLRTLAAVVAGLSAMAAGAAAIAALAATANSFAKVALPGPVVTLIGATLVALAVLLRAFAAVAVPRSPR